MRPSNGRFTLLTNFTVQKESRLKKLRFALVGGLNTAIDFGLLIILTYLGFGSVVANYFSTTTALFFSFVVNKKFTFRHKGKLPLRQIILFFGTTLVGLWVLQPIVISSIENAAKNSSISGWYVLIVAKLAATVVSLTWNYVMYSRFVFIDTNSKQLTDSTDTDRSQTS